MNDTIGLIHIADAYAGCLTFSSITIASRSPFIRAARVPPAGAVSFAPPRTGIAVFHQFITIQLVRYIVVRLCSWH
ncbi:hypothetical protein [Telluribacter sp. SYSU D00476]|uniref:hypothetical protein n=1 Tax=Telluribacter sp. SYSU D00476 TaxID=2811430 RepID=UPI001FF5CB7C|nr:hypothetical protein [Telluribacter sp. SYSU D00476]